LQKPNAVFAKDKGPMTTDNLTTCQLNAVLLAQGLERIGADFE
jgi:hypothetical protein